MRIRKVSFERQYIQALLRTSAQAKLDKNQPAESPSIENDLKRFLFAIDCKLQFLQTLTCDFTPTEDSQKKSLPCLLVVEKTSFLLQQEISILGLHPPVEASRKGKLTASFRLQHAPFLSIQKPPECLTSFDIDEVFHGWTLPQIAPWIQ